MKFQKNLVFFLLEKCVLFDIYLENTKHYEIFKTI